MDTENLEAKLKLTINEALDENRKEIWDQMQAEHVEFKKSISTRLEQENLLLQSKIDNQTLRLSIFQYVAAACGIVGVILGFLGYGDLKEKVNSASDTVNEASDKLGEINDLLADASEKKKQLDTTIDKTIPDTIKRTANEFIALRMLQETNENMQLLSSKIDEFERIRLAKSVAAQKSQMAVWLEEKSSPDAASLMLKINDGLDKLLVALDSGKISQIDSCIKYWEENDVNETDLRKIKHLVGFGDDISCYAEIAKGILNLNAYRLVDSKDVNAIDKQAKYLEQAEQNFESALKDAPAFSRAETNLAVVFMKQFRLGKQTKASQIEQIKLLDKAIKHARSSLAQQRGKFLSIAQNNLATYLMVKAELVWENDIALAKGLFNEARKNISLAQSLVAVDPVIYATRAEIRCFELKLNTDLFANQSKEDKEEKLKNILADIRTARLYGWDFGREDVFLQTYDFFKELKILSTDWKPRLLEAAGFKQTAIKNNSSAPG